MASPPSNQGPSLGVSKPMATASVRGIARPRTAGTTSNGIPTNPSIQASAQFAQKTTPTAITTRTKKVDGIGRTMANPIGMAASRTRSMCAT